MVEGVAPVGVGPWDEELDGAAGRFGSGRPGEGSIAGSCGIVGGAIQNPGTEVGIGSEGRGDGSGGTGGNGTSEAVIGEDAAVVAARVRTAPNRRPAWNPLHTNGANLVALSKEQRCQ
jgi:hypothetical protein